MALSGADTLCLLEMDRCNSHGGRAQTRRASGAELIETTCLLGAGVVLPCLQCVVITTLCGQRRATHPASACGSPTAEPQRAPKAWGCARSVENTAPAVVVIDETGETRRTGGINTSIQRAAFVPAPTANTVPPTAGCPGLCNPSAARQDQGFLEECQTRNAPGVTYGDGRSEPDLHSVRRRA
jgi:hypothetical protein